MSIQIQGFSGFVAEVEQNTKAMRVVLRPIDYGSFGIFQVALSSGTMAAGLAAAASVFQWRWSDATRVAKVTTICHGGAGSIAAFAAGFTQAQAFFARSYSANGSGGTAATMTGNNGKLRTSMGTSLVGDIRISSTAALTAGTWTLDAQPFASVTASVPATAGNQVLPPTLLFNCETESEYPLVVAQNEGFNLQSTVPATGTWTFSIACKWAELGSY